MEKVYKSEIDAIKALSNKNERRDMSKFGINIIITLTPPSIGNK